MTRILALVTDAFGGHGGIAQAASDVVCALAAQDNVRVIDVLPRLVVEAPQNLPAKVRQFAPTKGRVAFAVRALIAAKNRPDIIFCNHLHMSPLAALVAQCAGAKLVIQLHGIEIWKEPTRAQRAALERAHLVLCVSRYTRGQVTGYCDLIPERVVVLNNTVDPRYTLGDPLGARSKFDLDDEFVLLTVGRLDPRERYKGHDLVIAALPDLKDPKGRQIVYLIVGDGQDRARLEAIAQTAGVAERVRFLGQVPATDLPDLYRAADLFVLPSSGEGFGIAFLEATACGTPALGLAAGGAPDALGDGALGTLVGCAEALPEALQAAITAPPFEAEMLSASTGARFGALTFRDRIAGSFGLMDR